jgi:FixJ family two-component response regulator
MTMIAPPIIGVVDDDESVRAATGALLRSAGYCAETFESAELFLESKPARPLGCLILDVRMPGLDGLELQRRLNLVESTLPIIFISAHDDPPNRRKAISAGAIGFFRKPFNADDLLAAVEAGIRPDGGEQPSAETHP